VSKSQVAPSLIYWLLLVKYLTEISRWKPYSGISRYKEEEDNTQVTNASPSSGGNDNLKKKVALYVCSWM
jgi:hypothetical protein